MSMNLDELDTPSLVIHLDALERNIGEMGAVANAAGVRLRPHTKTHKAPEIARRSSEKPRSWPTPGSRIC